MILLRDLLKEHIQNIFGEEMGGGQGDPDHLVGKLGKTMKIMEKGNLTKAIEGFTKMTG